MSRNMKIIIIASVFIIVAFISMYFLSQNNTTSEKDKLTIVTTTFSLYDFSKQIVKENADVIFLLGPGTDSHSYEPSAADLAKIQKADVFIYIGRRDGKMGR